MLCTNCKKNEATVFYKQNINGKVTEYSLCPECAEKFKGEGKLEFNVPDPFGMNDTFGAFSDFFGLKPFFAPKSLASSSRTAKKKCTLCGSTFDELVERGKVGCAECYKTFENELRRTVENLHGKEKYVGRRPKRFAEKETLESKIASLKKQMKKAVSDEDFETAARLRDEIRGMEAGQNN